MTRPVVTLESEETEFYGGNILFVFPANEFLTSLSLRLGIFKSNVPSNLYDWSQRELQFKGLLLWYTKLKSYFVVWDGIDGIHTTNKLSCAYYQEALFISKDNNVLKKILRDQGKGRLKFCPAISVN